MHPGSCTRIPHLNSADNRMPVQLAGGGQTLNIQISQEERCADNRM